MRKYDLEDSKERERKEEKLGRNQLEIKFRPRN